VRSVPQNIGQMPMPSGIENVSPVGPLRIESAPKAPAPIERNAAKPAPPIVTLPKLVGVMLGSQPVAILSYGDSDVIIKVGEKLRSGHRLKKLTQTHAIFELAGKQVRLNLVQS